MATYYISPYGHDSNNGLGKHPNGTTDRPWRTLKKALETGGLNAGDTVYIAPGDYGGTITVAYSGTSNDDAGRIKIYGDPRNEQGFTTDGTTLIKPGMVNVMLNANRFSGYTTSTSPAFSLNSRNYITFKNIAFSRFSTGTNNHLFSCGSTSVIATYITFSSCYFYPAANDTFRISTPTNGSTPLNWLFEKCIFNAFGSGIPLYMSNGIPASDHSANVTVNNCIFLSTNTTACIYWIVPAGTYYVGGLTINNCSFYTYVGIKTLTNTNANPTYTVTANNCVFQSLTPISDASTGGQIVTNNCWYVGTLTNHLKGINDVAFANGDIPLFTELGQSALWGFQPKPFFTPLGLPGIGASSLTASMPTTDLLGKPRGSGGGIRPWLDYGINYIGTGSNSTSNTISASISTFTTNQWTGFKLRTITGSSSTGGQQRIITFNNSNVLTVFPNWQVNPVSGSTTYDIVNEAGNGLVQCGVASSATSNTIVDSTKNWTTNAYSNLYCAITDNTGSGQNRIIVSNDTNTLTVYPTWNITPALYSRFIIYGKDNITGSISGSMSTGSLTIMSQSFYPGVFTGYKVKITGGTGIGQERFISDNSTGSLVNAVSMSVLTCTPDWSASVFPVMNDTYRIYNPAVDYAVGCYELNDTSVRESGSIADDNGSCVKLTGPSNQEIWVPVNATPYTASIRGRYDINHGSTNPPQVSLLENLKIGVSGVTNTLSGAIVVGNNLSDWETTMFTFYPTSKGIVKFRLISRAASGFGNAYFDTFNI